MAHEGTRRLANGHSAEDGGFVGKTLLIQNGSMDQSGAGIDRPLELFCSYSTDDEDHRRAFERSLAGMRRAGILTTWNFRTIPPGENLDREISAALKRADVIVLLVSSSFIDSEYCWNVEMRAAVDRHDRGDARIVPVIVRSCLWGDAPFSRLNALPKDAKPVSSWDDPDEAWTNVAEGIRTVAEEIRRGRHAKQIVQPPHEVVAAAAGAAAHANTHRDGAGLLTRIIHEPSRGASERLLSCLRVTLVRRDLLNSPKVATQQSKKARGKAPPGTVRAHLDGDDRVAGCR